MRIFGFGKHKVEVDMVYADSGKTFGRMEIPIDQIPDTFEIATTLDFGEQQWTVVRAEPERKNEVQATGKLRVYLKPVKIVKGIDPSRLRFSLPTISNKQPALAPPPTDLGAFLKLDGDLWRQLEFVDAELLPAVQEEFSAIREVIKHAEGRAYRKVYMRRGIPSPLANESVSKGAVETLLEGGAALAGIVTTDVMGQTGTVVYGFAGRMAGGTVIYGCLQGGIFSELCVVDLKSGTDIDHLLNFAKQHGLLLVDWCRATLISQKAE